MYDNEIINYSFILIGNKGLTKLKIKIKTNEKNNLSKNIFSFDKTITSEKKSDLIWKYCTFCKNIKLRKS